MAKTKTVFYCTNCGNETPKWMGRCPSCGAYNTMEEHVEKPVAAGKAKSAPVGMSRKPQRIREITSDGEIRFSTGMGNWIGFWAAARLQAVWCWWAALPASASQRFCCKFAAVCASAVGCCTCPARKASGS